MAAEQRHVDWPQLIEEAVTREGKVGLFYSRFHEYSFLNRLLLRIQGVNEPVAPYKKWPEVGRQVVAGSRGYEILHPVIIQTENEDGEKEQRVVGFKAVRSLFSLSQTTGDELPPAPIPGWDLEQAKDRLGVHEVPFNETNGNVQGYSHGVEFAINPIAHERTKTIFHELGHIVLGHTLPHHLDEYQTHRGVMEFQAEAVGYLTMHELDLLDEDTAAYSRGYIQHWLANESPPDKAIQQVFSAADAILRAGRVEAAH